MNFKEFAQMYLEDGGMFDKSGVYEGMIGESVMELVETLRKQQHTGNSAELTLKILLNTYGAFTTPKHPIWKKWEKTEEGQKFLKENEITPESELTQEPEVKILIPKQRIVKP